MSALEPDSVQAYEDDDIATLIGYPLEPAAVAPPGGLTGLAHEQDTRRTTLHTMVAVTVAENLALLANHQEPESTALLADQVHSALARSGHLPDTVLAQVLDDHTVLLRGTCTYAFEKDAAEQTVRLLPGVESVRNHLRVLTAPSSLDIEESILWALEREPHLDAEHIVVTVADDRVRLSGQVRTLEERRSAGRAARAGPQTLRVENELTVDTQAHLVP